MTKPRVLLFAPAFAPAVKAGGPARVLTNMVSELDDKYEFWVVTADRDLGSREAFPECGEFPVRRGSARVFYVDSSSPRQVIALWRALRSIRFDLVMLNSIWNIPFSFVPALYMLVARRHERVLLMPRGEVERGALKLKSVKKRLLGPMAKFVYRSTVTEFGATSSSEAQNVKDYFDVADVVLTANDHPDRIEVADVEREPGAVFTLAFLGRIHPTKGLYELIRGLSYCSSSIKLVVAGPIGHESYWRKCQEAISMLPQNVEVSIRGVLGREAVPELLRESDLLGMLTAGENYGHVIAEALQCGCPVLVTQDTPWSAVVLSGGGEIVEDRLNAVAVGAAVSRWASQSAAERKRSRIRARSAFLASGMHSTPSVIELVL